MTSDIVLPPARYGLYALRRRSSATRVSLPFPALRNTEGIDATAPHGQQVRSASCCTHYFCQLQTQTLIQSPHADAALGRLTLPQRSCCKHVTYSPQSRLGLCCFNLNCKTDLLVNAECIFAFSINPIIAFVLHLIVTSSVVRKRDHHRQ